MSKSHLHQQPNDLPQQALGTSNLSITRIGFGAWAIGGSGWAAGWGSQDDQESIAAIRHAVKHGVNWIDTAAVYGLGHSEDLVCKAISYFSKSERPYVFTKCGLIWNEKDRTALAQRVGNPVSIRAEVENSLRRLQVERIDLMQIHWPAQDGTPIEVTWQTLADLKKEGKIRAIGLSNHSLELINRAERVAHVDVLQPPFSAIRREFAEVGIPWCIEHRTGVIVYAPMQSGLLTGTFSTERAARLPADDWRSRNSEYSGDKLARNLELAAALKPIAGHHGTSVASVAVAWTLAWQGISAAIVGARSPSQVDGWLDAARLTLSQQDLMEIRRSIESSGAGAGPTIPPEIESPMSTAHSVTSPSS
jgi:aryl-alcohol dehydrogenase-like predicted oxidoreductase